MSFNAEEFMNQAVEGSLDTKIDPLGEGDFPGVIDDVSVAAGEKDGKDWTRLDVKWKITDADALSAAGKAPDIPVTVNQGIMLDINEQGKLDTGAQKNVRLGKLRDAVNQNDGSPWTPGMLIGCVAMLRIGTRPDRNDPETLWNDIKSVVAIS